MDDVRKSAWLHSDCANTVLNSVPAGSFAPPPDSRQKVATVAAAACAMLAESCAILLMLFAIAALPRSSEATQKLARRSADRITAGNRVLV